MFSVNWSNLPADLRVGDSPDEELEFFRCFPEAQFDPNDGLLSDALLTGHPDIITDIIRAVEEEDTATLLEHLGNHVGFSNMRTRHGIRSPFLSATASR